MSPLETPACNQTRRSTRQSPGRAYGINRIDHASAEIQALRVAFRRIRYDIRAEAMVKSKQSIKAFAYLRTSSAANIGEDKDSGQRQLQAIETYAARVGVVLAGTYHDEAVKGSDCDLGPLILSGGQSAKISRAHHWLHSLKRVARWSCAAITWRRVPPPRSTQRPRPRRRAERTTTTLIVRSCFCRPKIGDFSPRMAWQFRGKT